MVRGATKSATPSTPAIAYVVRCASVKKTMPFRSAANCAGDVVANVCISIFVCLRFFFLFFDFLFPPFPGKAVEINVRNTCVAKGKIRDMDEVRARAINLYSTSRLMLLYFVLCVFFFLSLLLFFHVALR